MDSTYIIKRSILSKLKNIGPPVFGVILIMYLIVQNVFYEKHYPLAFFILIFAISLWSLIWQLTMPNKIRVTDTNQVVFHSLLGEKIISINEINSLKPMKTQRDFISLLHNSGKITFVSNFNGINEFLALLSARNPNIEISL